MRPALILAGVLACPFLSAGDAPPPVPAVAHPAADAAVQQLIAGIEAGRLETLVTMLPDDLKRLLVPPEPPAAADPAAGQNQGNRRGRGRGFSPIGRLAGIDEAGAKEFAGDLVVILRGIGGRAAGKPAERGPGGPGGMRGAMLAGMAEGALVEAVPRMVLAAGLESRQIAAIAAFWAAHDAWAAAAKLDDEAVLTQSAAALVALGKQLAAARPGTKEDERGAEVIVGLGHALHPFGLDGDAACRSAVVKIEEPGEATAVVTVTFTAYGTRFELPLRVAWQEGAWQVQADSPMLHWLQGGPGAFAGFGGRQVFGGGGRPDRGGGNEAPPAEGQAPGGGRSF